MERSLASFLNEACLLLAVEAQAYEEDQQSRYSRQQREGIAKTLRAFNEKAREALTLEVLPKA